MRISYIKLADGEERPVCFSLSAVEELQDEFGSLEEMGTQLRAGGVKSISKVLEILLRAGKNYCKAMGQECPPDLKCKPGDLIDVSDGMSIVSEIFAAIGGDSDRTVETAGKN